DSAATVLELPSPGGCGAGGADGAWTSASAPVGSGTSSLPSVGTSSGLPGLPASAPEPSDGDAGSSDGSWLSSGPSVGSVGPSGSGGGSGSSSSPRTSSSSFSSRP